MKPLVWRIGRRAYAWTQNGVGWIHEGDGWKPLDIAPGLGGTVLDPMEVATLVHQLGRPQVSQ